MSESATLPALVFCCLSFLCHSGQSRFGRLLDIDPGNRSAVPGRHWVILPVGRGLSSAFSECDKIEPRAAEACCVLPHLAVASGSAASSLHFQRSASSPFCSPVATVSTGRSCEIRSEKCALEGWMTCTEGKLQIHFSSSLSPSQRTCMEFQIHQVQNYSSPIELQSAHQQQDEVFARSTLSADTATTTTTTTATATTATATTAATTTAALEQVTSYFNLEHKSGKCVHPAGGKSYPGNNAKLVFYNECDPNRDALLFKELPGQSGYFILQHKSGKCIHPENGMSNPGNNAKLVFYNECDTNRDALLFKKLPGQSGYFILQHKSGKCVHPEGGRSNPSNNVKLVLFDGCDTNRDALLFKEDLAPESAAIQKTVNEAALARRSWRLANSGPPPSSGHWSVYELDFFRNFTVSADNVVHCHSELEPSEARILSSGFMNLWSRFAPENAFEDLVQIGKGWNSQRHNGPFQACIGLEFKVPMEVRCLRLYQSGLKHKRWGSFDAQSVTLQKFVESKSNTAEGTWETVSTWNSGKKNALPGWAWITLPVGLPPSHAFSECPTATKPRQYSTCCVWPHLAVPGFRSLNKLSFDTADTAHTETWCSPLSTVSSGRACRIKSAHCGVKGELQCVNGKVHVRMGGKGRMSSVCVKSEIKAIKHGGSPIKQLDYAKLEEASSASANSTLAKTTTHPPASGAAQAWRLANGGPPPSSGHWIIHKLVMYQSFTVDLSGNVYCQDRLAAANARVVSSGFMNYQDRFRPENVFEKDHIGQGWRSQAHEQAFEAWIGLEFSGPIDVKCIRLYQSGMTSESGTFNAQNVALQKFAVPEGSSGTGSGSSAPVDGEWISVTSWGVPGHVLLPGRTWLTLAVGQNPTYAFTECNGIQSSQQYRPWYQSCCVWPDLRPDIPSLRFTRSDAVLPQCSPLATVSEHRSCAIRSTRCGIKGQMTCTGGHVKLSFSSWASWLDSGGRCAEEQFQHIDHGGSPLSFFLDNLTTSEFAAPVIVHRPSFLHHAPWFFKSVGIFVVVVLTLVILLCSISCWRKHHEFSPYGELEMQAHREDGQEFGLQSVFGNSYSRLR